MEEEKAVHPDCRNASNPYHECSYYCFGVVAEAKLKATANDAGRLVFIFLFRSIMILKVITEKISYCLC